MQPEAAAWLQGPTLSVVVQSLSLVRLFATPWPTAHQASRSFTVFQSLLKFMPVESVMPPNHLILCHPLLLLLSIPMENPMDSVEKPLSVKWPHLRDFLRMKNCHLRSSLHFPDLVGGDQGVESEAESCGRHSLLPHTHTPTPGGDQPIAPLPPCLCLGPRGAGHPLGAWVPWAGAM